MSFHRVPKFWSASVLIVLVLVAAGCVPTARLLVGIGAGQAGGQMAPVVTSEVVMATPTPTATPEPTPTATEAPTDTATPEPTATNTPSPEPTATNTPSPTNTLEPTDTPEPTATNTTAPTDTPEPTNTPEPTATNTTAPTPTATEAPTNTPLPEPTETSTPLSEATATDTATPVPTVTSTPESEALTFTVVSPSVNLRGGPGTNFPVVGGATAGTVFPILGRNAAGDWYLIDRGAGQTAWIAAFLGTVSGDATTIPVTEEVPAPTVTPVPTGAAAEEGTTPVAQQPATVTSVPVASIPTGPGTATGRLLYSVADEADRWELWEYNLNMDSATKVADWRTEVDISKDGNQIVYYAWSGDVGNDGVGVWIMDGDFTNNREVIAGGAYPSFNPGGDRLVLNGGEDVYVIDTDGNGLRKLTRGEYPAWSPVSNEIVHRACVGGACGLYVIDADSQDPNAKRRLTEGGSDGQPAWSPDGNRIAYISQEDGNFEIYVINSDGSNKVRVTNDPASDGLPVWSPDGEWLAFRSDRGGSWAIYLVRPDGSELRKLSDASVSDRWFFEKMDWRS